MQGFVGALETAIGIRACSSQGGRTRRSAASGNRGQGWRSEEGVELAFDEAGPLSFGAGFRVGD
jgi:hypothetical protein